MTQFIAKFKVKYNGKTYTAGSVVDVKEEHTEEFKKFGWEVVETDGKTKGDVPPTPNPTEEEEVADEEEVPADNEEEERIGFTAEFAGLTKDQIKQELQKRGISYPVNATKAELLDLLE